MLARHHPHPCARRSRARRAGGPALPAAHPRGRGARVHDPRPPRQRAAQEAGRGPAVSNAFLRRQVRNGCRPVNLALPGFRAGADVWEPCPARVCPPLHVAARVLHGICLVRLPGTPAMTWTTPSGPSSSRPGWGPSPRWEPGVFVCSAPAIVLTCLSPSHREHLQLLASSRALPVWLGCVNRIHSDCPCAPIQVRELLDAPEYPLLWCADFILDSEEDGCDAYRRAAVVVCRGPRWGASSAARSIASA
jgi:hypothetical protein